MQGDVFFSAYVNYLKIKKKKSVVKINSYHYSSSSFSPLLPFFFFFQINASWTKNREMLDLCKATPEAQLTG